MEFATVPNWRNQAWLLKGSLTRKWSKEVCATQDALQTTFSFSDTFCIPQILAVLRKIEFFNSHRR